MARSLGEDAPAPSQPPLIGTDTTPWMTAEQIQAALHPAVMDDGRGGGGGPVFCISAFSATSLRISPLAMRSSSHVNLKFAA
jgi:hypothetical protein